MPHWAGLDDPVIEISVTPNRGDAFGVRGVARDLAAAGIGTLVPWSPAPVPPAFDGGPRWRIDLPEACPWILGRTIRGVRNGPSPAWLAAPADRDRARGRSTRWSTSRTSSPSTSAGRCMCSMSDKLAGPRRWCCGGARARRFLALNGKDLTLTPEDCVIADAAGVQSHGRRGRRRGDRL